LATAQHGLLLLEDALNRSERARQKLAPIVAKLLHHDSEAGRQVESVFTLYWQLARKADDMMDYSNSSDLKWLNVLQQVFMMCSKAQSLPSAVTAEAWLRMLSHFFNLMSMTCKGEVEDLLLRRPSILDYEKMVILKTGPWLTGRIACAAIAAGADQKSRIMEDLQEYGNLASLAYQVRNDVQDFQTEGKDIAIGKLNYPSVLLIEQSLCRRKALLNYDVLELAARAAETYEEEAKKIARRYSPELELLTSDLCSSA
jgi:geranylgeranyl pyrophosphate synthase